MRLFHGSTLQVDKPRIINRFKTLDFGTGFYTTANEEQAGEFARKAFVRRGHMGAPTVNEYDFDESAIERMGLVALSFDHPDLDWLRFVVHNRREGRDPSLGLDLVIGPVANDNVFRTIDMLEAGDLSEMEAIERFKVNDLFNQYLFCNERALVALRFVRSYEVV